MNKAMIRYLLVLLLAGPAIAQTTAIVNVHVVPMHDEIVLPNQTVIVEDGRIAALGPVDTTPVPDGSTLVDGTDRYLLPGLTEMHAHIPPVSSASLDRTLSLFALNGVTTVRGMLGHASHIGLRDSLESGERFGPRLITSGPSLNGNSVDGPADGARKVHEQHRAGFDFVKLHPGLSRAEFDAIAAAARELGMPFAGHVSVAVGVADALEAGMATIDHLDGYFVAMLDQDQLATGGFGGFFDVLLADFVDDSRIGDIVASTRRAGTANVPTQVLFENVASSTPAAALRNRPEMRYMPAETVAGWARSKLEYDAANTDAPVAARAIALRRQLIAALHEAGAPVLLGSDAPQVFNVPGFSLHRELEIYVASGLTPFEALETGTTATADFLGTDSGRIEAGLRADFVLLDDNPLDDIANTKRIHGVMLNGRWISATERERRLRALRRDDE